MKRLVATALAFALPATVTVAAAPAPTAVATSYTWRNAEIGGGGFVPGIVFNPGERGLVYARTDIGGAYRRDPATGRWIPLLDSVGHDDWGHNGVVSLATDPLAPDKVYVAAGMYTNSWDPDNGAILRSSDRGTTWQAAPLPFKLGGNMPGRGMGERLAIDPNLDSVLYLGAPSGNGLWRSTDSGVTWAKVTSFPAPADEEGVVWVTFDPSTGTRGSTTRTIYAGVADKDNAVYRSTDGGTTWARLPGTPTGFLAHKGVLDPVGGYLYLATSDTGGPYDGAKGDVWKYATRTGAWTRISPVPSDSADDYFGYSGLTIDRQHPDTLMVATQVSWWPDVIFFRSTDGGATWTRIWDFANYPERSLRYTQDVSSVPWLTFGTPPAPPVPSPKLGWMTESVEIDPFDSDHLLYGTGATVYGTSDLTKWDSGGTITIKPDVGGLEETAVLDLISPPSGAPLLSALGDIGGFRHDSLDAVPSTMYTSPVFTTTTSLDFAELSPATIVRVGTLDRSARPADNRIAFSADGGKNWVQGTEPAGSAGGGTVAAAADGSRFVWSPDGTGVHYSNGSGSSWTASSGIPAGAVVESDRVDPERFYGFAAGKFYVSTDGGATFTASAATGLPAGSAHFKAVPGAAGDVWLAGGAGLWHSTDSGASFTKLAGVAESDNIGFGKAAPGRTYPTLYTIAKIGEVRGIFRSDDGGGSWTRINDDRHQYGNIGAALTGDPRVYGRVYVGTNGRGVIVGDSGAPASSCTAVYTVTNQWPGGFQAGVRVSSTAPLDGWRVSWSFPDGQRVTQAWNARVTQSGAAVTATDAGWNRTSVDFGFTGTSGATNGKPAVISLNGQACS